MKEKYLRKTMNCDYGRHALVHLDEGGNLKDREDVKWILPSQPYIHPTRLDPDYRPRHALNGGPVCKVFGLYWNAVEA